jgi:hypothetical protein
MLNGKVEDDFETLEEQAIATLKRIYCRRPTEGFTTASGDYWHKSIHNLRDGTIIEVIVTIPAEKTPRMVEESDPFFVDA